jgi:hypothetical protein
MIAQEKAKLFKEIKWVALALFTTYLVTLFFISKFMMTITLLILALFTLAFKSTIKQKEKEAKPKIIEDSNPLFALKLENKNTFYFNVVPVFICLIPYSSIIEVPYLLPITLIISLVGIVLSIGYFNRWSTLSYLAFEKGLRLWREDVLYEDIHKYQMIRKKNGKVTFELNTGDNYHRFILDESQAELIIKHIKKRTHLTVCD